MHFKKIKSVFLKIPWKKVLIIFFIFAIFLLNTFHEKYPDEFDSIVGGRYILQGKVPYRDWFQHHQPLAYLASFFILIFSGNSFVRYRIFLAIFFFVLTTCSYLILKKRIKENISFYFWAVVIIAFSATYFWGQMMLADTLAAYLILPAFALVFLKGFYRESFDKKDLIIFSAFAFLGWFTSMTYTYLLFALYLYAFYLFFRSKKNGEKIVKKISEGGIILLFPFLLFSIFLLITGSLDDYYFSNITYNQNYYIYNYPRPLGAPVNPVRYAIIIAHDFFNNFYPLLSGIKNLSFNDPFNSTLALSNLTIFILILLKRKYSLFIPFLAVLIYSNSRSNPAEIKETDYQAAVYILTSTFNGFFSFFALKKILDEKNELFSFKIVSGTVLIILGAYWFFTSFFIPLKFFQKVYAKYMGQAPLIYDRPQVAPIINKLVARDDYAWVGPFEFEELFYLQARIPSKYHWFLNHAASSDKIKTELLTDFKKNKPKIIVFNRLYAPWGGEPATFNSFFTEFLDQNYFRLFELNSKDQNFEYKWKMEKTENFNLDGDFNFDKEYKEELIQKLFDNDLIEKREKT